MSLQNSLKKSPNRLFIDPGVRWRLIMRNLTIRNRDSRGLILLNFPPQVTELSHPGCRFGFLFIKFDENRWKLFLQASRSFLNPPGTSYSSGRPSFLEFKFLKKHLKKLTSISARAYKHRHMRMVRAVLGELATLRLKHQKVPRTLWTPSS